MGHLSIHCGACGSDWVIYHRDDWREWKARTCPVCGKAIDPGTWERQVLRGFGEMEDANQELLKDHTQYNGTLFTVSYIPDVPNEENTDVLIEDLRGEIDNLRSIVESMFSI